MMTMHLPPDLERSIEAVVNNGRYASVDDAMAEAARLLLRQETQQPQPAKTVGDTGLGSIRAMHDDADLLDQAVEHAMNAQGGAALTVEPLRLARPARHATMASREESMAHTDFNELRRVVTALPPEQMRQLRDDLDRKLAESAAEAAPPARASPRRPIPRALRDSADELDQIVADAYRKRPRGYLAGIRR